MILKMKFSKLNRLIYITVMLGLPLLSFGNKEPTANALYAQGKYEEAAKAYQQLINSGYHSAALYYNLGNAEYKLGETPSAVLYYEKAHKLAPGDEDINANIRFVNLKTTDKIDETPEFFISKWWHEFILSFSVNGLAWASVVLIFAASVLLGVYFFSNSVIIKKASFYGALALLFIGLVNLGIAAGQVSYFDGHKQAIIFTSTVNVKGGPLDKASTLFVLHEGTKVNVLDTVNGWLRVKLANGNEGWMKVSDVREI